MAIGFAATMLLLPVTAIGQDKALEKKSQGGATSSPSPVLRYQESQLKESQQIQIQTVPELH